MKKPAKTCSARPDTLRWAMFMAVFGSTPALAQTALQAADAPGGTPLIHDAHGVPVIAIVAPDANGLSHNRFLDYNVGQPGLVLNNALQAGQSQLAGALAANPQFQGQAASTILNEVISRSASLIEGPQEIFGRPADYVLANPNGITVNGGSFINTTRAGFLVGKPIVEDGRLRYLDTLQGDGSLTVLGQGAANREGALALIAPRIETLGPTDAATELDIIAGRNRVDVDDGSVLRHQTAPSTELDATLFGAMRAGRVRVVSTTEGAGVRMLRTDIQAQEGISVRSAGGLHVEGSQSAPGKLSSERGQLSLEAARALYIRDVEGRAEDIRISAAGKLTLDTRMRERIDREQENWKNKALFITYETYDRERTRTERKHSGTVLLASGEVSLSSGSDTQLNGARIEAGGLLQVSSAGKLTIDSALDSIRTEESIRHRKHLWRGDRDTERYQQSSHASQLTGGRLTLDAGHDVEISGSTIGSSGDMLVNGKAITVQSKKAHERTSEGQYRGDLLSGTFFAERGKGSSDAERSTGSTIEAAGRLEVSADQVLIKGSRVHSKGDGMVYSRQGGLSIESTQDSQHQQRREDDSQLFGLLGKRRQSDDNRQRILISDVSSSTNLRLASEAEMNVRGSRVSAQQELQLQARGNLEIASDQGTTASESAEQRRTFAADAGETRLAEDGKPGSKQYAASVGYTVHDQRTRKTDVSQVASELEAGQIAVDSDGHLQIAASRLTASAGRLDLKAQTLSLDARHDQRTSRSEQTETGGGLAVTGGMDRLGSAFEGHRQRHDEQVSETQARRTELSASGDIGIQARHVTNEAARIDADGQLQVNAETVDNRAAEDTYRRQENRNDWRASLGASVEYRDVTRPVERLVNGQEAARFQQAGAEDAMAPPSIGADATVAHLRRQAIEQRGTAQVSELAGTSVKLDAGTLNDEGTAYQARAGALQIEAQQHTLLAARDTTSNSVERLAIDADLRGDTSTGQDLNARLAGKGGSLDKHAETSTARPGSLYGQAGIQVQLGSDGKYEGSLIDGGDGAVRIASQGKLQLLQASDRTAEQLDQLDGNGWIKGGNRPTHVGGEGRAYLDRSHAQRLDTQARVAQLDAKGKVELSSAGDMLLEGSRIGSRERPVEAISLDSGGLLEVLAANDTHQAKGSVLGGGLEVSLKQGQANGGSLGGHFTAARTDEQSRTAQDASFTAKGSSTMTSQAREDQALHLQGVRVAATRIDLQAPKGGLLVEGSTSQEHRDNLALTAGAGLAMNKTATPEKDSRGLHGRVQVELDRRDNLTHASAELRADRVTLSSLGDTRLEDLQVQAGRVTGQVGADLLLASRKDSVDSLTVKADARLSQEKNPQGYTNAVAALAGPAAGKVTEKVGPALSKVEPGFSPTVKVDVSHVQRDTVATQSTLNGRDGIELQVGGATRLVGARLQSANGSVELQSASLAKQSLSGRDYRRDVGIDGSNAPVDLGTAIADVVRNKGAADGENALDMGLLRTSGHSRNEQWPAHVQGKEG